MQISIATQLCAASEAAEDSRIADSGGRRNLYTGEALSPVGGTPRTLLKEAMSVGVVSEQI